MAESQGTLDNTDLTTSEKYIELSFGDNKKIDNDVKSILIRYYNDLNQDVVVKLYGTTKDDASWDSSNETWDLSGVNHWQELETIDPVSADTDDYSTLTDDWEFLRVGVNPKSDPTEDDFEVVTVTRRH